MSADPLWIVEARKHVGIAEVPGVGSNGFIKQLWLGLKGGTWYWKSYGEDDSRLPWCGAFVANMLQRCGIAPAERYASAKAWAEWGSRLSAPVPGCIVVFERHGGGHVGFVVGRTAKGELMVLGGNQGNRVSIAPFDRARAIAYVWPAGLPLPPHSALAVLDAGGAELSTNEA